MCCISNKLWIALFCLISIPAFSQQQKAENGHISLKLQQLLKTGQDLDGNWLIYWDTLLDPDAFREPNQLPEAEAIKFPSLWNGKMIAGKKRTGRGKATYRLKISLDQQPDTLLGLFLPDFFTAYKVWVNGREVAANGQVGWDRRSSKPHWLPQVKNITTNARELDLILQISNYHHRKGGVTESIRIGASERLADDLNRRFFFIFLILGLFLMTGFFLFAFWFVGKKEKGVLFFSLFCIVHSYYLVGSEHYPLHHLFPNLPFALTVRLEYLSLYWSLGLYWLIAGLLFPNVIRRQWIRATLVLCTLYSLWTIFGPVSFFSSTLNVFLAIIFLSMCYGMWQFFRSFEKERPGLGFGRVGFACLFFMAVYSIGDNINLWQVNTFVEFTSYLGFLLGQSMQYVAQFAQEQKRTADEASAASQAKTDFLATMSHEIRTPMNGVVGMADLLSKTPLNPEQTEYLTAIKSSGQNLVAILNDILDLSKIEAEKMQLESRLFNLPDLIREVVGVLRESLQEKDLAFLERIDEDVPRYLNGDPIRLRQILLNLLSNAIKFTQKGSVGLHLYRHGVGEGKIQLGMEVRDTGIGMSDQQLTRLFEPFTQAETSTYRKYGGTGLGLAIIHRLIQIMNGSINVESELGGGSVFTVIIPFSLPNPRESGLPPEPQREPAVNVPTEALSERLPLNILVAEDHPINQQLMRAVLRRLGYQASFVDNGRKVIEAFEAQDFDLVFMDVQMPLMNGLEASSLLRAGENGSSPPTTIIAMTANALEGDREKCLAAGMDDYIAKPIQVTMIEAVILKWGARRWVGGKKV
ncbi:ATP-binding protein [Flavilitoribacter nigricans]|nr:ATP-binding protein [Flavilitoribacter nigricans]